MVRKVLFITVCIIFNNCIAKSQLIHADSSFTILPDKIIFETKEALDGTIDGTKIYSTKFRICLPKEFLTGQYSQTFFQFYFPSQQAIFIETNWNKEVNKRDVIYPLSKYEVQDVFDQNGLSTDPDTIKLKKKRFYVAVKTKYASIYLYNILKVNKQKYIDFAKTFMKL